MPFHDDQIPSSWQIFISTYLLEHLTTTFLDESPFEYVLPWNFMTDSVFLFTTSSLETFFPFLTRQFGDNIPCDLKIIVRKCWDFRSSKEERGLKFRLEMEMEAYLHIPDGSKQFIGRLEFTGGEISIKIFSEGMLFKGMVEYFKFE